MSRHVMYTLFGILLIALPPVTQGEQDSLSTYSAWADKMVFKNCPKDGSSWKDHPLTPKVANDDFVRQSIALCEAYQQSRLVLRQLTKEKEVFGFYVFIEQSHSNDIDIRLYQKIPIGPFLQTNECSNHREALGNAGIGTLPCSLIKIK